MDIIKACTNILNQLESVISQVRNEDYTRKLEILQDATIGQHVRHTLEFFICLITGRNNHIVDYDARTRDILLETDRLLCLSKISELKNQIATITDNKAVNLQANYNTEETDSISIPSNYLRELAYNIEHAIHHMAIMKIGLQTTASYVELPEGFGVASSTLRYRKELQDSSIQN